MRVVSVTATPFGGIDGQTLELASGLTIVYGRNGSGKSTWHAALYAGLCGRVAGLGSTEIDTILDRMRPRGRSDWSVSIEVELADRERVTVDRDLTSGGLDLVRPEEEARRFTSGGHIDLALAAGLDRRSFAVSSWIRQRREVDDWADGAPEPTGLASPDLGSAIDRLLGSDEAARAAAALDRARYQVAFRLQPAREAAGAATRALHVLEAQRDEVAQALDLVAQREQRLDTARRAHRSALAAANQQEERRLREVLADLRAEAGLEEDIFRQSPVVRDAEVHPEVADAARDLATAKAAYEVAVRVAAATPPAPVVAEPDRWGRRRRPEPPPPPVVIRTPTADAGWVERARHTLAQALTGRGVATADHEAESQLAAYYARCAEQAHLLAEIATTKAELDRISSGAFYQPGFAVADPGDPVLLAEEVRLAETALEQARQAVTTTVDPQALAVAQRRQAEASGHLARLDQLDGALDWAGRLLGKAATRPREVVRRAIGQELAELLQTMLEDPDAAVEIDERFRVRVDLGRPLSFGISDGVGVLTRVALGRHLARGARPAPLLLDDITSRIDEERATKLLTRLQVLAQTRQVVIFAHDPTTRAWALGTAEHDPSIRVLETVRVDQPVRVLAPGSG